MNNTHVNPLPSSSKEDVAFTPNKWSPLVQQLSDDQGTDSSPEVVARLANAAAAVEQCFYNECLFRPTSGDIHFIVEAFLRACMPASPKEAA